MTKLYLILGAITALIGVWYWDHNNTYQAGFNSAIVEMSANAEAATIKKLEDKQKELIVKKGELISALEATKKWQIQFDKVQIALAEKPKVKYVEKIIRDSQCRDLGNDFVELWNSYASSK